MYNSLPYIGGSEDYYRSSFCCRLPRTNGVRHFEWRCAVANCCQASSCCCCNCQISVICRAQMYTKTGPYILIIASPRVKSCIYSSSVCWRTPCALLIDIQCTGTKVVPSKHGPPCPTWYFVRNSVRLLSYWCGLIRCSLTVLSEA